MAEQASSIEQRAQLRRILRALVSNSGGGKGLAAGSRLKEPQISRCLADHHDDQLPIDVVLDAMILSGSPILVAWLAAQIGYEIVEAGAGTGSGINESHGLDLVRKATDAAGTIFEARKDGVITGSEEREIINALNANIKSCQDALRALGEKA